MIEYILAEDATSPYRKTIYAKKGETVKLIKDHGRAMIVEDERGNRFPINSKNIISLKNELEPALHNRADHVEKKPGKQLRSKKGNDIHGSDRIPATLTLF